MKMATLTTLKYKNYFKIFAMQFFCQILKGSSTKLYSFLMLMYSLFN